MLPLKVEQRILDYRVEQLGAGLVPQYPKKIDSVQAALQKLVATQSHFDQAKGFAVKNKGRENTAEMISQRCTQLVSS